MRRALAAALLGISLWIGTLAWSGFIMTRTVLDPGRSEAVADALLEDEDVRAQVAANLAGAVRAALPDDAPVDDASIDAGAAAALDSPEVEALLRDAFVQTHQAFLGEGEPPESVPVAVPGGGVLEVELPTERVPDLGGLRRALDTLVPVLAGVAAFGAVLSLVVTSNRPAILRRAGFWAIGLSLFVLAFAFGVPALAQRFAPDQGEVVAALVGALAEASRGPALVLAGAGLASIVVSLVWRPAAAAVATEPRGRPAPAPARPPATRRRVGGRTQSVAAPARGTPPGSSSRPRPPASSGGEPTPPRGSPAAEPTVVQPAATSSPTPSPPTPPTRANARWVEGVGWVHDGPEPIPEGARWVPGVGYLVEPE